GPRRLPPAHRTNHARSLLRRTDACRRVLPRTGLKYGLEPPQADHNVHSTTTATQASSRGVGRARHKRPTSRKAPTDGLDGIERAWEDAHRRGGRGDAPSPRQYREAPRRSWRAEVLP